jgi:NAD-dependent dihydropyrimidine dehydrogenase PreA subunit
MAWADQHPLIREPGRGRVVEERRNHRVVEQLEGDKRESVLEAAERSCHGCGPCEEVSLEHRLIDVSERAGRVFRPKDEEV